MPYARLLKSRGIRFVVRLKKRLDKQGLVIDQLALVGDFQRLSRNEANQAAQHTGETDLIHPGGDDPFAHDGRDRILATLHQENGQEDEWVTLQKV